MQRQSAHGLRSPERQLTQRRRWPEPKKIATTALVAVIAIAFLIPFYWLLVSSLRQPDRIFADAGQFFPSSLTLQNFDAMFDETPVVRWFMNSVILAAGSTIGSIVVVTMAAYALARIRFPFRNTIFVGILASQMLPFHLLLADRGFPPNAIENPAIFKRGKYYYLLMSWDFCCRGVDSTYKIAVGRSTSVDGPYVDRDGVPVLNGGGTVILDGDGNQIGTGAADVIVQRGNYYIVHHYYDADANGVIRMQIRSMEWEDGWPSFEIDEE